MSKQIIFIGIVALLILCISSVTNADQYYMQYSGNCFQPRHHTSVYLKPTEDGQIYHNDSSDEYYFCPVNFNVSDGSTYFIKSIGMRYTDNLTDGYITVVLRRKNLYTGGLHTVAIWSSGLLAQSGGTASKGTEPGVKLVDTKKFTYWLRIYFYRDGDVNPYPDLRVYQVRIHYGT